MARRLIRVGNDEICSGDPFTPPRVHRPSTIEPMDMIPRTSMRPSQLSPEPVTPPHLIRPFHSPVTGSEMLRSLEEDLEGAIPESQ